MIRLTPDATKKGELDAAPGGPRVLIIFLSSTGVLR